MALEAVDRAPALEDFTLLSEHQQQTPGTFFGGKPVLHLHAPDAILKIPSDQFAAQEDLKRLTSDGLSGSTDDQVTIPGIDVWVTSRHILFYSTALSSGLRIEYPNITVTAQDGNDVLLELNLSDTDTADEDIEFLQLRITATKVDRHAGDEDIGAAAGQGSNGTTSSNDAATALFTAISDCQELNPDPPAPGEEGEDGEEAFDETAPGATGWITSENMADFMDENGNFRMPAGMTVIGGEQDVAEGEAEASEPLGEGAGRTRTAAEALEEEESKWQRTG